ncbi:MAG: NAD(P)/FAD-dependent oxidoreductase [Microscillaceae bacterium]|nr:NAD(P)/FAD-dependent oxidoreductase [Microscillaceae bacterium]
MTPFDGTSVKVAVIGAGPAGLTAAYQLSQLGHQVMVFEADSQYVGGISRTVVQDGFRFDIGGHRFFSKSAFIEDFWTEILGDEMLTRPRCSRIYYRGRFFRYPLAFPEALWKLGLWEATRSVGSYAWARLFPRPQPDNFEDWVRNRFGQRLYEIFFKTYTEKVWGMSCREISADWAVQRIQNFSLGVALRQALQSRNPSQKKVKTLIEQFRYPRLGPGQMWETVAAKIKAQGQTICMGQHICQLEHRPGPSWILRNSRGESFGPFDQVISSAPLSELLPHLHPRLSPLALQAAQALRYRDFVVVGVMAKNGQNLPEQWIYLHDPSFKAGRVQNFRAWSPDMVPGPDYNGFGLEYFCSKGDTLWEQSDAEWQKLARQEIVRLGLVRESEILQLRVIRQSRAYPVYDQHYTSHLAQLRQEMNAHFPGFHFVGRNGMHRYNNQDHAMMTGWLTALNIAAGHPQYDVWEVNEDAEYHENAATSGLRQVPFLKAREDE